jgi:hypothetical protein
MHRHEMQQSNIYLGIYIIGYYFCWKNQGVTLHWMRMFAYAFMLDTIGIVYTFMFKSSSQCILSHL